MANDHTPITNEGGTMLQWGIYANFNNGRSTKLFLYQDRSILLCVFYAS